MVTATRDPIAASRLKREVERAFADVRAGSPRNKTQLAAAAQVTRPALDNWLEAGVQPPVDAMHRIAAALDVDYGRLWTAWLGLPMESDALERIASALERAYPVGYVPDPPDVSDLTTRLDASQSARRRPARGGSGATGR